MNEISDLPQPDDAAAPELSSPLDLLSRCERQLDWDLYVGQFAKVDGPGVAALDEDSLEGDIAALRRRADIVVLSAHWGKNYAPPTEAAGTSHRGRWRSCLPAPAAAPPTTSW